MDLQVWERHMDTRGPRRKRSVLALIALLGIGLLFTTGARADWHTGRVISIHIAYDGSTVTFQIDGHSRANCTCYPIWGSAMCLNRSRSSFKEEVAMLYSARARGATLSVNIDEATCQVVAIGESD
jgi:hypothetical protein